jgi:plasmid maintenance system antidote protein VapI
MTLTEQLREAVNSSGLTLYRVAVDAGLPYAVVHRFATSQRSISLETADKLAELFGMRLTRPKRPKPKQGR